MHEAETLQNWEMFRPPVNRSMRQLDRAFFRKTVPLAAARVLKNNQIATCRSRLGHDLLKVRTVTDVQQDLSDQGKKDGLKALLLHPGVRPEDSSSWPPALKALVEAGTVAVYPYDLKLDYDNWSYQDIMAAVMPEAEQEDIQHGYSAVGHIAHLNLREQFLPYKHIMAEVILSKNPHIHSVINKVEQVGMKSEYRTFQYEVLAGSSDLNVETKQLNCRFRFDYSKVYWNSQLGAEHERIVNKFKPGQVVCDVMAGVGPFAVPAGKKNVFVWANDLNPESYNSLIDSIQLNKVGKLVQAFNEDGREFIRRSAQALLEQDCKVDISTKPKAERRSMPRPRQPAYLTQPKTFDHYVMNLPASATTMLDAFVGLYKGKEALFAPHTSTQLPMVHVYCFSTKSDDNEPEKAMIREELSQRLQYTMSPGQEDLEIFDVRDVAPKKRMFCASFRLPAEVAFR